MKAPVLIFGWGNPSRGDDALGPLFVERLDALRLPGVECLTDFQLQVEHALDLHGRQRILFVDASVDAETPFSAARIEAQKDDSFTTHAMTPQSVLQVYRDLEDDDPAPTWLLAIRAASFELGEAPTATALANLDAAIAWTREWLARPEPSQD